MLNFNKKEVGLTKFLPEIKQELLKYYKQQELLKSDEKVDSIPNKNIAKGRKYRIQSDDVTR